MVNLLLQEKIDHLQLQVERLLHVGDKDGYKCADDLSQLNKEIHNIINELYFQRGATPEQEASLCLAILTGYNVAMYAHTEDEVRRQAMLARSRKLLEILPPSPQKQQLSAMCYKI